MFSVILLNSALDVDKRVVSSEVSASVGIFSRSFMVVASLFNSCTPPPVPVRVVTLFSAEVTFPSRADFAWVRLFIWLNIVTAPTD